jgi:glycyl-tRNA synthetase beta chain
MSPPNTESPNPATLPLLIEIGCEEIPARFLVELESELIKGLQAQLKIVGLAGQFGEAYSTPRRLVAHIHDVLERQRDRVEEVIGPPAKVAFDKDGKPTRAAESFVAKNGKEVQDLIRISTAKGEYVAVRKLIPGAPALEVLPEILPAVITGLSFRKSMYWENSGTRFIRPIRWVLAALGEGEQTQVVPFEVAGVKSGNQTRGHRVMGSSLIAVNSFEDYSRQLRQALVEFNPEKRLEQLRKEIQALLEASSLNVVQDRELEEWVVNSTEWPGALAGSFDERFLKLPREILITVMRDHQKYFALEDNAGNLQPKFIASLNLDSDPKGYIRAGHEHVLAARFADAGFFWNADQRIPLADRLPMLEGVTYQAKLGSYGDKVRRMEAIATRICHTLAEQGTMSATGTDHVLRAVQLSKCDLTTQMVQEFPELQGVVGGLYAKVQNEPQEVAEAIYDHYLPVNIEDRCPRNVIGAAVSLADKVDGVLGGFRVGLDPTGSSDPFGLRRQGNGIIKLLVEALPSVDLRILDVGAQNLPSGPLPVLKFLGERFGFYATTLGGARYDTVRAVLGSQTFASPATLMAWIKAVEKVRDTDDFLSLAQAAKRTQNILVKSAALSDFGESAEVDVGMLTPGAERDLYEGYQRMRDRLKSFDEDSDYEAEFRALAALRPLVDRFFDEVLVMDEDKKIRANRLALLAGLRAWVFQRFVDLSQIESSR